LANQLVAWRRHNPFCRDGIKLIAKARAVSRTLARGAIPCERIRPSVRGAKAAARSQMPGDGYDRPLAAVTHASCRLRGVLHAWCLSATVRTMSADVTAVARCRSRGAARVTLRATAMTSLACVLARWAVSYDAGVRVGIHARTILRAPRRAPFVKVCAYAVMQHPRVMRRELTLAATHTRTYRIFDS